MAVADELSNVIYSIELRQRESDRISQVCCLTIADFLSASMNHIR